MKRYETIIVLDSDTGKDTWEEISGRMIKQIEAAGGLHIKTDDWGSTKLAYEIRKKTRGHYYRVEFCAPGEIIKEMERYFRLDEKVMRYLTVLIDEEADVEQIKNESQEKPEAATEEAAPADETPAATDEAKNEEE